jgi:hypothetical protein
VVGEPFGEGDDGGTDGDDGTRVVRRREICDAVLAVVDEVVAIHPTPNRT